MQKAKLGLALSNSLSHTHTPLPPRTLSLSPAGDANAGLLDNSGIERCVGMAQESVTKELLQVCGQDASIGRHEFVALALLDVTNSSPLR